MDASLAYGKLSDGYEYLAAVWQRALDGAIPTGAYPMGGPSMRAGPTTRRTGSRPYSRRHGGMRNRMERGKKSSFRPMKCSSRASSRFPAGTELTYSPEVFKRAVFGGVAPTDDTGTPNENFLCATLYQGKFIRDD